MSTCNITSNGSGDAFKGNKYVNNGVFIDTLMVQVTDTVSLEPIRPSLIKALDFLQENKVGSALERLEMVSEITTLDEEARLAVSCLRIILTDEVTTEDIQKVEGYSQSSQLAPLTQGLAEAALLKLIEQRKGVDSAHQRFEDISGTLNDITIPQYVYLRRLATKEYVEAICESIEALSDFELVALFEKSIDLSMFEQAKNVLDRLQFIKPLHEFKRESLILQCLSNHNEIDKDFYCLTYEEKTRFDKLCTDLVSLIDESELPDFRLLHILFQLFRYTHMTNVSVESCLKRNKEHLEAKNFFDDDMLESLILGTMSKDFEELRQCEPEELMQALVNQKEEDHCNFHACQLLYESGDSELILGTLNLLAEKDNVAAKANMIALAARSASILEEIEFPFNDIESAIRSFKDITLNASFVNIVAPELAMHGYPEFAVLLSDIVFGDHVPWLSEPFYSYLSYLHASRQFQTLEEKLDALALEDKEREEVVTLYSILAGNQKDYQLAASLLRNNIDKYQEKESLEPYEKRNLVYLWGQYLQSVYTEDKEKARELSYEIPLSIFDDYFEDYSWRLLFYFCHRIEDVAETIIDWFCNDPHNNAKYYFNLVFHAHQHFPEQNWPMEVGKYLHAFNYTGEHQSHIKLVVRKLFVSNCPQYLIESNGIVARRLIDAKKGDALLLPVKLFTLADKLSPIHAVYHIASEIMDDDEKEVFHIIKLPEKATAEEVLAEINKIAAPIKESREKLKPLMEQPLPVDMKYRFINGQDNFQKAILAVLCPDIKIVINNSNEPPVNTQCTDFVIDEMTAIFLACLGPNVFDNCTWHMTDDVYTLLNQCCETFKGKWPVYNDDHYTVFFEEYDDLISLPSNFIANLSLILERTQQHSDSKLNVPLELKLKLRDLCTHSFLMSHALAVSLNIGHFCIDHFTRIVLRDFEFSSVPLHPDDFQEKIIRSTSIEVIHNLICLNIQNNISSMAYACMEDIINDGDDTQLDALARLITLQSTSLWEQDNIKALVQSCLCKLVQQTLLSEIASGVENVLLALLQSLTSSAKLRDKDIIPLVECLPIPLLYDEFFERTQPEVISLVTGALRKVTELYCESLTKAVRKNNHSASGFWEVFARLC
ncbi:hypothetical protein [Photobacterium alginatilyticum]|uniref:Uncharacterized protein n=1 Tax=Photobacterium alginatilyticum TaxID=1775171 RepID=A0ABW9YQK5_9GAMM|nr:hypothetical protein [Photobacterium alginatilyticum]NBI55548.1 hypothetical protein [Photobacterium alginatilyticum]